MGAPWDALPAGGRGDVCLTLLTVTTWLPRRRVQTTVIALVALSMRPSPHGSASGRDIDAKDLLKTTIFLANKAVLNKAIAGASSVLAREVYQSSGTLVGKPTITVPSAMVISALILLQAMGLETINTEPAWASRAGRDGASEHREGGWTAAHRTSWGARQGEAAQGGRDHEHSRGRYEEPRPVLTAQV